MPQMMVGYKTWVEAIASDDAMAASLDEATKPRLTTFWNIAITLNHMYVVVDVFRHHLLDDRVLKNHRGGRGDRAERPPLAARA